MRHFRSAIVVLLFITANSRANELTRDELAKRLSAYQDLKSFEVPFSQTKKLKGMDLELRSKGLLRVKRRDPYSVDWKVQEPARLDVRIQSDKIEILSGEGEKQTRQIFDRKQATSVEATKGFGSLGAWMRMDATELSQKYRIESAGLDRMIFLPRMKEEALKKVEIRVGKDGHLSRMQLLEHSDDEIEIEFGKLRAQ